MRIKRLYEYFFELDEDITVDRFIDKFGQDTYDRFKKNRDRLKNKGHSLNVNDYVKDKDMTPEKMSQLLTDLEDEVNAKRGRVRTSDFFDENGKLIINGKYKYIGRYGKYDLYQPLDVEASMSLGVNTGWCTTGRYGHYGHPEFKPSYKDAKEHWDMYTGNGIKFYYFVDHNTGYGRYAVALYPKELIVRKFIGDIKVNSANYEIWTDEDNIDYSLLKDNQIRKALEDIGAVWDIEDYSDSPELKIDKSDIEEITLLSAEEAKELPENIRAIGNYWWLRSPGSDQSYAAFVLIGGSVYYSGSYVNYASGAVRPALKISNLKFSNLKSLKLYDIVKYLDNLWYVISDDMLLSVNKVGETAFNQDWKKSNANKFEGSDIQKWLQNWLKERLSKKEGLNKNMRRRNIKEDFDKKDVTVTAVDWKKLQRIVNSILRKNGKDFYVEFHSANSRHLSNPHDVFISVYESETGEVIDDEKLSARYYPSGDVIHIFGSGLGDRPLESPEEVADFISKTVEYWYNQWSR